MKKNLVLGVLLLTFTVTNAQSKIIKANPLGLLFGVANIGYEFETKDSQSATLSGIYFDVLEVSGAGVGFEYRFYFGEETLRGWHAGPSFGYMSLSDSDNTASVFTYGGEVGHQWILREHFAVELFAGLAAVSGGEVFSDATLPAVSIGFSLGYAW